MVEDILTCGSECSYYNPTKSGCFYKTGNLEPVDKGTICKYGVKRPSNLELPRVGKDSKLEQSTELKNERHSTFPNDIEIAAHRRCLGL